MFNVGDTVVSIAGDRSPMRVITVYTSMRFMDVEFLAGTYMGRQGRISVDLVTLMTDKKELSTWTSKDNTSIPFKELSTAHLFNIIAMLHRKEGESNEQRNKLVSLEKEALRRLQEEYVAQR